MTTKLSWYVWVSAAAWLVSMFAHAITLLGSFDSVRETAVALAGPLTAGLVVGVFPLAVPWIAKQTRDRQYARRQYEAAPTWLRRLAGVFGLYMIGIAVYTQLSMQGMPNSSELVPPDQRPAYWLNTYRVFTATTSIFYFSLAWDLWLYWALNKAPRR